jgi:hypothetical protein
LQVQLRGFCGFTHTLSLSLAGKGDYMRPYAPGQSCSIPDSTRWVAFT